MTQNNKSQLNSAFLLDSLWWRNSIEDSLLFLPYCLLPAALLCLANISLLIGMYVMSDMSQISSQTLEQLTQKLAIGALTSLVGIVFTVFSLTIWLNRLTAFCRFRLLDKPENKPENKKEQKQIAAATLKDIAGNQKTLFKFWLVFSLYLLVPIVPLTIVALIQTIVSSPSLKELHFITLPYHLMVALGILALVLVVVSFAMTITGMGTVSRFSKPAMAAANTSIKLFFKFALQLCLVSAFMLALNAVISTPQIILMPSLATSFRPDLTAGILGQIWLCLTSSFLWTFSVSPVLEFLRRDLIAA